MLSKRVLCRKKKQMVTFSTAFAISFIFGIIIIVKRCEVT